MFFSGLLYNIVWPAPTHMHVERRWYFFDRPGFACWFFLLNHHRLILKKLNEMSARDIWCDDHGCTSRQSRQIPEFNEFAPAHPHYMNLPSLHNGFDLHICGFYIDFLLVHIEKSQWNSSGDMEITDESRRNTSDLLFRFNSSPSNWYMWAIVSNSRCDTPLIFLVCLSVCTHAVDITNTSAQLKHNMLSDEIALFKF